MIAQILHNTLLYIKLQFMVIILKSDQISSSKVTFETLQPLVKLG